MLRAFVGGRRLGVGNIQIEITETTLIADTGRVRRHLSELVEMGVEVAMDDYGTGYSSLDLLSRFPFSTLKLDHGVVRRMAEDAKNTHIIRASLLMARELGLKTVGEGIENKAAYVFLAASGCIEGQGFWMSPPVPRDDFALMLNENRTWPACRIGLIHDATSRHAQYKRKLVDVVYTLLNTDPAEWDMLPRVDLVHSPAHVRLDRFFKGAAVTNGEAMASDELLAIHRAMHEDGRELFDLVHAHAPRDKVSDAINCFMSKAAVVDSELTRVLQRWLAGAVERADENTWNPGSKA